MLPMHEAMAAGGKLGLLEGKAVALMHPIGMAGLFLFTLFTGYQGLQWRQLRELGDELKPLDKELKAMQSKMEEGASPSAQMKEVRDPASPTRGRSVSPPLLHSSTRARTR